jgi:hypothetical protein
VVNSPTLESNKNETATEWTEREASLGHVHLIPSFCLRKVHSLSYHITFIETRGTWLHPPGNLSDA